MSLHCEMLQKQLLELKRVGRVYRRHMPLIYLSGLRFQHHIVLLHPI